MGRSPQVQVEQHPAPAAIHATWAPGPHVQVMVRASGIQVQAGQVHQRLKVHQGLQGLAVPSMEQDLLHPFPMGAVSLTHCVRGSLEQVQVGTAMGPFEPLCILGRHHPVQAPVLCIDEQPDRQGRGNVQRRADLLHGLLDQQVL